MTNLRNGLLVTLLACLASACVSTRAAEMSTPTSTIEAEEGAADALSAAALPVNSATPTPEKAGRQTAVPTTAPAPTMTAEATLAAAPSATPHPLLAYTIPAFQAQRFPGGAVQILKTLEENERFKRHYVAYPSGELTISGTMHVPAGPGPFPVLILLHGYFERDQYYAGADTWQAAEYFAERGYLVLAPDLRSWGESDPGLSIFHMGLVADVLNLLSSLPSIPEADPTRVGLWGHSMGGGISTKVLTIDDRVQAAVLYAPNSADDADLIARWGPGCLAGQSEAAGDNCNPGEFIPADTPPELIAAYLSAASDPDFLPEVAPIYHLEQISVPLQIHIGTADGALRTHTPPEWSAKLGAALQAAGKEIEVFTYPGQGHYFADEAWTSLLERSLALFDRTLRTAP